jgi:hypothetical protein
MSGYGRNLGSADCPVLTVAGIGVNVIQASNRQDRITGALAAGHDAAVAARL